MLVYAVILIVMWLTLIRFSIRDSSVLILVKLLVVCLIEPGWASLIYGVVHQMIWRIIVGISSHELLIVLSILLHEKLLLHHELLVLLQQTLINLLHAGHSLRPKHRRSRYLTSRCRSHHPKRPRLILIAYGIVVNCLKLLWRLLLRIQQLIKFHLTCLILIFLSCSIIRSLVIHGS